MFFFSTQNKSIAYMFIDISFPHCTFILNMKKRLKLTQILAELNVKISTHVCCLLDNVSFSFFSLFLSKPCLHLPNHSWYLCRRKTHNFPYDFFYLCVTHWSVIIFIYLFYFGFCNCCLVLYFVYTFVRMFWFRTKKKIRNALIIRIAKREL